ncbi:L,D-transpeptidase [Mycolicibacillus parakoreensis]|uniref:L,D-transpeptidase n=2 Tax=Mycolicibacillus parakoreensis TaxID=1069221 RepID=A0ABY3U8I7_9MYCO|nr:L,D-transpeptidase [Mycolicibacillus parakoreensis]MCV7314616.1 L,D-transpeptidase [Mycolicibacillus parakoreensis]ULN54402.1 L,D-transpeptidase [Mycolicibacillus parakoreensis]
MVTMVAVVAVSEAAAAAAIAPPAAGVVAAVAPAPGQVVGVAHPVVVEFAAPVADRRAAQRALRLRSAPPRSGRFAWVDPHTVHWTPERFWPAHSTVALSVGGRRLSFETGPAVLAVADLSEHTFTVSIDGVSAAQAATRMPAPHHRPHYGQPGVFPASMGKEKFPTPVGTYPVLAKDRTVTMDSSSVGIPVDDPEGYLLEVDHAVRISSRGLYVHAAPWALRSLGVENVSHGCISLSPTDAQWYFDTVRVGDPVVVRE